MNERRHTLTMLGLIALAAIPRLYRLDTPGLTGNEDYVMLCARAVLDHGAPLLPGGGFYPRALPFSYASALLVSLFGTTEIAVRLIPALCSIAAVGVGFALGTRVFGRAAGLIAGIVLALSPWEIMFGRTARMYSALACLFLLALYGTYRVTFEGAKRWRVPAIAAGMTAVLLHQLGAVLVVPYAVLLVLGRRVGHKLFVVVSIVLVTSTALCVIPFELHQYSQFRVRVDAAYAQALKTGGATSAASSGDADEPASVRRPNRPSIPDVGGGVAVLLIGASVAAAGAALKLGGDRWYATAVLASALLVSFRQGMLAAYVTAAYLAIAFLAGRPPGLKKAAGILGVVAVGASGWLAAGMATGGIAGAPSAVRALIAYPPNFLEFYARLHPAMFLVAVGAVGVIIAGFVRDRDAFAPQIFVASALVLPAIGMGFHPSAQMLFNERYVFHLDSCFILLYAFGVWRLAEWLASFAGAGASPARKLAVSALVLAAVLLVTGGIAPAKTQHAARQRYGVNPGFEGLWGESRFLADHQGSSRYVCDHAGPDDLVVPMDILNHWAYCPRADYQLTLSSKHDAEGWMGLPSGRSIEPVADRLLQGRAERVWVALSGFEIANATRDPNLETMLAFRRWDCARRVYEGRDGLSDVWVLERSCVEQHRH